MPATYTPVPVEDFTRRQVIHPIKWESAVEKDEAMADLLETIDFGIPSVFRELAIRDSTHQHGH